MSAHAYVFNNALEMIVDSTLDLSSQSYYVALMKTTFTPDVDAQEYWADVSAYELDEVGPYTAGGVPNNTITVVRDDATNKITVTFGTATWPVNVGEELRDAKGAMVYNTSLSGSPLVAYFEFDEVVYVSQNNSFVVTPVFTLSAGEV